MGDGAAGGVLLGYPMADAGPPTVPAMSVRVSLQVRAWLPARRPPAVHGTAKAPVTGRSIAADLVAGRLVLTAHDASSWSALVQYAWQCRADGQPLHVLVPDGWWMRRAMQALAQAAPATGLTGSTPKDGTLAGSPLPDGAPLEGARADPELLHRALAGAAPPGAALSDTGPAGSTLTGPATAGLVPTGAALTVAVLDAAADAAVRRARYRADVCLALPADWARDSLHDEACLGGQRVSLRRMLGDGVQPAAPGRTGLDRLILPGRRRLLLLEPQRILLDGAERPVALPWAPDARSGPTVLLQSSLQRLVRTYLSRAALASAMDADDVIECVSSGGFGGVVARGLARPVDRSEANVAVRACASDDEAAQTVMSLAETSARRGRRLCVVHEAVEGAADRDGDLTSTGIQQRLGVECVGLPIQWLPMQALACTDPLTQGQDLVVVGRLERPWRWQHAIAQLRSACPTMTVTHLVAAPLATALMSTLSADDQSCTRRQREREHRRAIQAAEDSVRQLSAWSA